MQAKSIQQTISLLKLTKAAQNMELQLKCIRTDRLRIRTK